jgi:hypothetical protein
VLFEIFGLVASSEGALISIADLRRRKLITAGAAMIPQRAATFFAPVQLDSAAVSSPDLYLSPKLALVKRLDFDKCSLSGSQVLVITLYTAVLHVVHVEISVHK